MSKLNIFIALVSTVISAQAFAQGVGAEGETQLTLNISNRIDATPNAKDVKVVSVKFKKNVAYADRISIERNDVNCDSSGMSKFEGDPSACVTRTAIKADLVEVKVQYNDFVADARTNGDTSSWQTQTASVYLSPALFTNGLTATAQVVENSYAHEEPIYAPNGGDCFDAPAGCVPSILGHHSVTDHTSMIQVTPALQ